MIPSPEQHAFFNFLKTDTANGLLAAVAGSGKTTTIVNGAALLPYKQLPEAPKHNSDSPFAEFMAPSNKKVLYMAYNKHIADVLAPKMPKYAESGTLHSVGYGICISTLGIRKPLNKFKLDNILTQLRMPDPRQIQDLEKKMAATLARSVVTEMVSLLKNTYNGVDIYPADATTQFEYYGIDVYEERFYDLTKRALTLCLQQCDTMDFDDMFWLPLATNCEFPKYEIVFADEFQDFSVAQFLFLSRFGARQIVVGDENQSIYGFRGANPNSIEDYRRLAWPQEFPLTTCYRCSQAVIEEAQKYVPRIQAREGAPQGSVDCIYYDQLIGAIKPGDAVLCRVNAPLVQIAMALISNGVKATVRGRDIGAAIAKFAARFFKGHESTQRGIVALKDYVAGQKAKGLTIKQWHALYDKYKITMIFAKKASVAHRVSEMILALFSDENSSINLSTIHKFKGDEAENVYQWIPDWALPPPRKDWEVQQEINCAYVAVTRAKMNFKTVVQRPELEIHDGLGE